MGCLGTIATLQYYITPPLRRPPRANRHREFPCFQVITGPASFLQGSLWLRFAVFTVEPFEPDAGNAAEGSDRWSCVAEDDDHTIFPKKPSDLRYRHAPSH